MHKKLIAACVSLVAFAALPAIAAASPVLQEGGVNVPTGSTITATNVGNTVMTTSAGNIECTTSMMGGTLTVNSGTLIEGDIEEATFTGTESEERCSGPLGAVRVTPTSLPWCLKAGGKLAADTFELRGGLCTEASRAVVFTLDTSFFGECTYSRGNVTGTFTTGGTQAHLTASEVEFTRIAGGFGCPASGKLDMTYKLETTNGTALQIK